MSGPEASDPAPDEPADGALAPGAGDAHTGEHETVEREAVEPAATEPRPAAHRLRVAGRWIARILVALVGALIAVLLFARVNAPIGPFDTTLAFRPFGGGAQVGVPPLGS